MSRVCVTVVASVIVTGFLSCVGSRPGVMCDQGLGCFGIDVVCPDEPGFVIKLCFVCPVPVPALVVPLALYFRAN